MNKPQIRMLKSTVITAAAVLVSVGVNYFTCRYGVGPMLFFFLVVFIWALVYGTLR